MQAGCRMLLLVTPRCGKEQFWAGSIYPLRHMATGGGEKLEADSELLVF